MYIHMSLALALNIFQLHLKGHHWPHPNCNTGKFFEVHLQLLQSKTWFTKDEQTRNDSKHNLVKFITESPFVRVIELRAIIKLHFALDFWLDARNRRRAVCMLLLAGPLHTPINVIDRHLEMAWV